MLFLQVLFVCHMVLHGLEIELFFKNKLSQQKDGVCVGSFLGSALANIIVTTTLEDVIIKLLVYKNTIMLIWYNKSL